MLGQQLTDNDSHEARALTRRMPQKLVEQDPTLQNCVILLRAVWQRKYDQVYQILRELPWPDLLKPLVQEYEGRSYIFFLSPI